MNTRKRLAWAALYSIQITAYAVASGLDKARRVTEYMHQPLAPWVWYQVAGRSSEWDANPFTYYRECESGDKYGARRHTVRALKHVFGKGPFTT